MRVVKSGIRFPAAYIFGLQCILRKHVPAYQSSGHLTVDRPLCCTRDLCNRSHPHLSTVRVQPLWLSSPVALTKPPALSRWIAWQGEDFFDTERYPSITFTSDTLTFSGDSVASVKGNLTIKGITKPVTLTVTSFQCMTHPMRKKDACGANATTQIKRSDFNMSKYVPNVSDEVTLILPIEAVKP